MAEKKTEKTTEKPDETPEAEVTEVEATPEAEAPPEAEATREAETTPEAEAVEEAAPEAAEEAAPEAAEEAAPEAEATPEAVPAEEPAGPAPQSQPKKKFKRLPRALRPKKTRPTREKATERRPITRLPKPEGERGQRQERRGVVVSNAMDKTIVVRVDTVKSHRKYKKVVRRSQKFHVHDERNEANPGDLVRIVETRPLSKTKRWRLAEVVEVAK